MDRLEADGSDVTLAAMKTYEAYIDGETVEWVGERPSFAGRAHVLLKVELLSENGEPNGKQLARMIREAVARYGGITSIDDPVEWQRQQREDRPLPGREP
jgi:hypothetical protein